MKKYLFLCLALLFSSCQTLSNYYNPGADCRYKLSVSAPSAKFTLFDMTLDTTLNVTNVSQTMPVKIKKFEGKLFVNDNDLGDISFGAFNVAAASSSNIKTSLKVPYTRLTLGIINLVKGNNSSLNYRITGYLYFETPIGDIPVPLTVLNKTL